MKKFSCVFLIGFSSCMAMEKPNLKRRMRTISEDSATVETQKIETLQNACRVLATQNYKLQREVTVLKDKTDVLFGVYSELLKAMCAHHVNMEKLHGTDMDLLQRVADLEFRDSEIVSLDSEDIFSDVIVQALKRDEKFV